MCWMYPRSSYYEHQQRRNRVNAERERLKRRIVSLHEVSRGAAGARTLSASLRAEGESVGRFKAGRLMREAGISSSSHASIATVWPTMSRMSCQIIWIGNSVSQCPIKSGAVMLPISGRGDGFTWLWRWFFMPGA